MISVSNVISGELQLQKGSANSQQNNHRQAPSHKDI